jgi:hypothetical protein
MFHENQLHRPLITNVSVLTQTSRRTILTSELELAIISRQPVKQLSRVNDLNNYNNARSIWDVH